MYNNIFPIQTLASTQEDQNKVSNGNFLRNRSTTSVILSLNSEIFSYERNKAKTTPKHNVKVNIAVLLPENYTRYAFSMSHAEPAIGVAIDKVSSFRYGTFSVSFNVIYIDSKCKEKYTTREAFKIYQEVQVNLFLGPVCDLQMTTVAKQTVFWNIPMISVGATDSEFSIFRKRDYALLTRAGPSTLDNLADCFRAIMKHFRWWKVKIAYAIYDYLGYFLYYSQLAGTVLHEKLNFHKIASRKYELNAADRKKGFKDLFGEEINMSYGGMYSMPYFFYFIFFTSCCS